MSEILPVSVESREPASGRVGGDPPVCLWERPTLVPSPPAEHTTERLNGRSLSPGYPFSRTPEHLEQIIKTLLASSFKQVSGRKPQIFRVAWWTAAVRANATGMRAVWSHSGQARLGEETWKKLLGGRNRHCRRWMRWVLYPRRRVGDFNQGGKQTGTNTRVQRFRSSSAGPVPRCRADPRGNPVSRVLNDIVSSLNERRLTHMEARAGRSCDDVTLTCCKCVRCWK